MARIKLSNIYDVLNGYVIDTSIAEYKHGEVDLAIKHINNTDYINNQFKTIYVMDRGYFSLSMIYKLIKENKKIVIRLKKSYLKSEQKSMSSDDEFVEIKYQYDRIRNYKDKDEELYQYYEEGNSISIRMVNIKLSTGEIETIMTNISEDESYHEVTVSAEEFTKLLIRHLVPYGFKTIRYYGFYRKKSSCFDKINKLINKEKYTIRKTLLKHRLSIMNAFNRDPYTCPRCGNMLNYLLEMTEG